MRPFFWFLLILVAVLIGSLLLRDRSKTSAISGLVRDDDGPVPGANVRIQGEAQIEFTDANGRFHAHFFPGHSRRVAASKPGYFIAGAALDTSPLILQMKRLPAEDCDQYQWVDPTPDAAKTHQCGNCHGEMYREWSASGHAHSASNRRFLNLYDGSDWHGKPGVGWSLLAEHKDGAGVCTSCHAPTVSFDDPAYFDLRQVKGVSANGVHCDYCHKIAEATTDGLGLTHGRFALQLLRPAEGQLFFGPLADVDRGEDAYSPLYRDSRYCASCHEGTVFGVHVYSTYSEWLKSPSRQEGKQCQTCHMAPTGKLTNLAPGNGGLERDPATLGNHRFFAGSQADMLRRCLKLDVVMTDDAGGVRVAAEVTANQVGHRVPTGFVDRNLVLVLEGQDGDGRPVRARAGPKLPSAAGEGFAGLSGRLYARLLKDFQGHSPVPFWRAQPEAEDSRLTPGHGDRIVVEFPPGVKRLRLRLLHRRFWPEVARTKSWPEDSIRVVDQIVTIVPGRETRWCSP